ncbi:MAG: peptidoglycan editing factor PgeF [Acetivibrionales bacterium]
MKSAEKIGNGSTLVTVDGIKRVEFDCLDEYRDILVHCMSTRLGGVSSGECAALNLGFARNDSIENVYENFRLFCKSAGIDINSLVCTRQVHGTRVCIVGEGDRGKGFPGNSDVLDGVDGLVTTTPGVTMVTFHADCAPVFLFEPGIKAASLVHSGWRGTLGNIVSEAISIMKNIPGFNANRVMAVIGPSIGCCCFEVDDEVYSLFFKKFKNNAFYKPTPGGKWKIDLKGIIEHELRLKGIPPENIHNSGICTKCRKDLFFSHRGDEGKTGSLAAFMQIRL